MALSLIMIFAVASMVGQIQGLQNHEFRLGTDATVSISFRLNGTHQYYCEIYSTGIGEPFCLNGTIDPDALRPDQRNRFKVNVTLNQKNLTIDLHISNIQERDGGVYIWAVQQHLESGDRVSTSDVYVSVNIPPGRTKCRVLPSPYSSGLREVHCSASVGSDGGGLLICYQNDVKTPFQSAPAHSATDVTAVFWMDAQHEIKCCSHEANYEKVAEDCNDFTKAALIEYYIQTPKITTRPLSTNLKNNGKPVSASSPLESEHSTDSASTVEETKYLNSDHCVCNEYSYLHYYFTTAIGILLNALVISVCINKRNGANRCTKCGSDKGSTGKSQMNQDDQMNEPRPSNESTSDPF